MRKLSKKLNVIHRTSEKAIGTFTQIEKNLQESNLAIDKTIEQLKGELGEISSLLNQAELRKAMNVAQLSRISELIRGESQTW